MKSTKTSVSCLQSSMVVGMSWSEAAGTGEIQFIEGPMNANMSEAEQDPLPSETGPQGSIPT